MKLRLYKFSVEILDCPSMSDEEFAMEVAEQLAHYFEAEEVRIELVETADFISSNDGVVAEA